MSITVARTAGVGVVKRRLAKPGKVGYIVVSPDSPRSTSMAEFGDGRYVEICYNDPNADRHVRWHCFLIDTESGRVVSTTGPTSTEANLRAQDQMGL